MPTHYIVLERWWIRDGFCPAENAWRAVISGSGCGLTSASDATPWYAIARAAAYVTLKRCGLYEPTQAQEPLALLVARAQAATAATPAAGRREVQGEVFTLAAPTRRASAVGRGRRAAKQAAERIP